MTENIEIVKGPGFHVGQQFFPTLIEAQKEALHKLIGDWNAETTRNDLVETILDNASTIVKILNPPRELRDRKPRKDKGTKRKNASTVLNTKKADAINRNLQDMDQ